MKFALIEETIRYRVPVSCGTCRYSLHEPGKRGDECYCLKGAIPSCRPNGYSLWEPAASSDQTIIITGYEEAEE